MPDEMRTVHSPLRWSLTGLAGAGTGLAVTAAILAYADGYVRDGIVYTVVAAALSLIAVGVARSLRWVVAVTLVGCAGQIAAIIGLLLELVSGVAPSKAATKSSASAKPSTANCPRAVSTSPCWSPAPPQPP
jgi:hypothetical protein